MKNRVCYSAFASSSSPTEFAQMIQNYISYAPENCVLEFDYQVTPTADSRVVYSILIIGRDGQRTTIPSWQEELIKSDV